jgi:hypothetical protein
MTTALQITPYDAAKKRRVFAALSDQFAGQSVVDLG